VSDESARHKFRVLTRTRGGYNGAVMHDVQLQSVESGQLLWARTFTDPGQATSFQASLERDLEMLDGEEFRRRHGLPSSG
jgi:hypothetical protein